LKDLLWAVHSYFISPVLTIYFIALLVFVSIIEPVARPIRRFVPPIGNLDLSVLIIALAIPFLRDYLIPRLIALVPF